MRKIDILFNTFDYKINQGELIKALDFNLLELKYRLFDNKKQALVLFEKILDIDIILKDKKSYDNDLNSKYIDFIEDLKANNNFKYSYNYINSLYESIKPMQENIKDNSDLLNLL